MSKKDGKISKKISFMIAKYEQLELDTVSNNLVCDYLKLHENPRIQILALGVKSLVPSIQIKGENPSIGDIFNHDIASRKILVPVKKELPNQLPDQAKSQNSSMKNVSGIVKNPNRIVQLARKIPLITRKRMMPPNVILSRFIIEFINCFHEFSVTTNLRNFSETEFA